MASRGSLDKLVSVFPVILIATLFILFWQYGSVNRCYECVEVKDWGKVQPLTASIFYKVNGTNPGIFEADFINSESFLIRITGMSMADIVNKTGHACFIQTVKGVNESRTWANESVNESRGWIDVSIKGREKFEVTAICPTKKKGDSFDLQINMAYITNLAGAKNENTEKGRIAGPVKYYPAPRTGNTTSP